MNILLVHRHFWPDVTTYAIMLRHIGSRLVAQGHQVTVISSQPSYNELYTPKVPSRQNLDGVNVVRVPLFKERKKQRFRRLANALLFALQVAGRSILTRPRYDIISVATFPPVLMGLAARTICKVTRARYIYHCLDIYPEIAVRAGILRSQWWTRLLERTDTKTCNKAARVITLSNDMMRTLQSRGLSDENIVILNNFVIDDLQDPGALPTEDYELPGGFRVVFAGNMGRFQGLDRIVDAARNLSEPTDAHFVFLGAGAMREDLMQQAGDLVGKSVFFIDQLPIDEATQFLASADLGIVSLIPGISGAAYPSKLMTYTEAGCRVLAVIEKDSDIAHFVRDQDLGSVATPGDGPGILEALTVEIERGRLSGRKRALIKEVADLHFGRQKLLDEWVQLYRQLETESSVD